MTLLPMTVAIELTTPPNIRTCNFSSSGWLSQCQLVGPMMWIGPYSHTNHQQNTAK